VCVSEKNNDIGIVVCPLMAIFGLVTGDYLIKRLKLEFRIEFNSYRAESTIRQRDEESRLVIFRETACVNYPVRNFTKCE
jgi:predicted ATP-grasp superfamily ATP-dependent carboligase